MNPPLVSSAAAACDAAIDYARQADFAGWDKHDALNSPLLAALSLGRPLPRMVVTQLLMRSPWNLRPLLRMPRTRNPKGLALFAMAAIDRYRTDGQPHWQDLARELLDWLEHHGNREFPGLSWGYGYPWQDAGFFAPRHFPNRVVTCFVAQAFLEAYAQWREARHLAVCRQACRFLLEAPRRLHESDSMLCLSYVPQASIDWVVMDVSILAGAVLARTARLAGDERLHRDAVRLVRYVVDKQTDYGAWYYSHPPEASRVKHDNYHTGFILDAILDYTQATGDEQFMPAYWRGLEFYARHLFTPQGAPKWRHDRDYPYDVHGAAQGILTFSRCPRREDYAPLADRIVRWSLDNLYDSRGFFYYQRGRWHTKRFCFLRWCNGWMARALAAYVRCAQAAGAAEDASIEPAAANRSGQP